MLPLLGGCSDLQVDWRGRPRAVRAVRSAAAPVAAGLGCGRRIAAAAAAVAGQELEAMVLPQVLLGSCWEAKPVYGG